MSAKFTHDVGLVVSEMESEKTGAKKIAIGFMFPLEQPVHPDQPDHDDNFQTYYFAVENARKIAMVLQKNIEIAEQEEMKLAAFYN